MVYHNLEHKCTNSRFAVELDSEAKILVVLCCVFIYRSLSSNAIQILPVGVFSSMKRLGNL